MPKKRSSRPAKPGEATDRRLAATALKKQAAGQKPNRDETAALRRVEKARDEELRQAHYHSIRKTRDWALWSGRQVKVLNEQAARYGIPIGRREIELPAVVRWLHDFLAANARKLAAEDHVEPPALERQRAAKARREELRLEQEMGRWLKREDVHAGLGRMAHILRTAGETLGRTCGERAQKILNDALGNIQREIDRLFGADNAAGR